MGSTQVGEGLSILNRSPRTLPGPSLLHQLIQQHDDREKLAIDFLDGSSGRSSVSYAELDLLSDRLAHRISQELDAIPTRGSEKGAVIPLLIPQSPDLYVAIFAILKSGAAYCPLNLDAPTERIKFILQDTQASLVLSTSSLSHSLREADPGLRIIVVGEKDSPEVEGVEKFQPETTVHPSDLAYIMYTSGSTGTPKGVGISHTAATQSLLAHDQHIPSFSRFLQFAAPTFDVSVFEIFFPLFRGSTLVCCDRAHMLADLSGVIRRLEVDACELTPAVTGSLLKSRDSVPGLKLLLTIGEMLTEPVVAEFGGDSNAPSLLWGMYGPTEAAIHCTLQPAFGRNLSPRCIGFPLDTVSAFVIRYEVEGESPLFEILPLGKVGELAVGGHQLATGYLNRPEQTAAAFIETELGRIYKTGDKARMLPDGTIECLGRVSEGQIKLNGQRMELGEVEQAVLRTPGCHSAYVCVISNILVAFAAADSVDGMQERIKANCKSWLPAFMVPSEIIVRKAFPRLPSGKVDRISLKQEYIDSQLDVEDEKQDHRDDLERTLCEVAEEILCASTQMSTRLASVGLDSLSAIQFAARLRDRGVLANTMDILEAATLAHLYACIMASAATAKLDAVINGHQTADHSELFEALSADPVHHGKIGDIERIAPCTTLQTSMIVESLKDPRLYRNTVHIQFKSGLDPSTIRSGFLEVAQRNEILRSGFVTLGDTTVRVIWKHLRGIQVNVVDSLTSDKPTDIEDFLEHPIQVDIDRFQLRARITLHHAIYDGWTFDLILDDLSSLALGSALPARPQFSDITQYLDGAASGLDEAAAREFWAEHLRGSPGSSLPNFRTTPIDKAEILSLRTKIEIDPQSVKTTALEARCSPQALFQACLAWLWSAITGSEDVVLGTVLSGRTLPVAAIEQVMGPCLFTLPVRVNLSESSTVADLVQSLHAVNRAIMKLAPMKLTDIKKAAGLPTGGRLFDVLLIYQESLSSRKRPAGVVEELSHEDHLETKLLLEVEPRGDAFVCQWTWHSDVFSRSQVEMFAQHFDHLGRYCSEHLASTLNSIPRSFPQQSLSAYTSGMRPVLTGTCLSDVVEKTASLSPDAEALCFAHLITPSTIETESLTYRQLNSTANRIARHLRAQGASPGGIVAILMEKSPLFYCSILAILKTGCAYLPLLPSTPHKRVQRVVETAQPRLCLVDSASSWGELSLPCHVIDLHTPELGHYDESNLGIEQVASQLAYVIFTSGTTGTPKGVAVWHKNTLSNIEVLSHIYPFQKNSRMLQSCSQAFDVSVFEIFFTWVNGLSLCAATNDTLFQDLELSIRKLGVTHSCPTPSVTALIEPANAPNISLLALTGELLTDDLINKWGNVLWQGYGPSEVTNIFMVRNTSPGDSPQFLGWPFENSSSFVFYPDSEDMSPIGCLGEICAGGDQVVAGYLNMPDLTARKFFEHPQYGRLYRSGDLGRMLPDGSLIIQGRIDTQVKLRGQRIELHEIQSIALESASVKACSCILLERGSVRTKQLALFYVPASEDNQTFNFLPMTKAREQEVQDLMHTLRGSLPTYMIPSFIFPISRIPLTPSGKINNNHLQLCTESMPTEEIDSYSASSEFEDENTEWTEVEKTIARVLGDVLKLESKTINRLTAFAVLGLDSLSAAPVSRRLSQLFNKRIPLSQVLQNPNISRLAHSITSEDPSIPRVVKSELLPPELIHIVRQQLPELPVQSVLPCTPLQTAMLAASASSNKSAYLNQMLFRIQRDPEELIAHWNQMRVRHEILRTCFVSTEDSHHPLVQVVLEPGPFSWGQLQTTDLEQCALKHRDSLPSPIDSLQPPLALATILVHSGEWYISFACHHALYDGVAMGILLSEVEALALGQRLQPAPSFYSFLQEALSLPEDVDDFWRKHFQDFCPAPVLRGAFQVQDHCNSLAPITSQCSIPLSSIETRLQDIGFSLLSLCQAAWSETLFSVTKTSDVCFGNVLSGRSIPSDDVASLVAPCFNTIPMRVQVANVKSHRELMKTCQMTNAGLLPYQFTPLRRVHALADADNTHLFDTLLLLQPPARPLNQGVWSLKRDSGSMDVPVVCEVIPSPELDELQVFMHVDDSLISDETSRILREVFLHALEVCLHYPSSQPDLGAKLPMHIQSLLEHISPPKPRMPDVPENSGPTMNTEESWGPYEAKVREVVVRLSGILKSKIRKHTSIHRYGLDSISAVQISHLLRQELLEVSAIEVLENPTCAGIASRVKSLESAKPITSKTFDMAAFRQSIKSQVAAAKLPVKPQVVLPCTPLQQGMLSQFLLSSGANYFNFMSWDLDNQADCRQLEDAWKALVARQEILRAGFISISHPDTSFAMTVYGDKSIPSPVRYLASNDAQNFNVERWRRQASANALEDLSWPPWQVVLVDTPESKTMHLGMHHALFDAFSLQLMMNELHQILESEGLPPAAQIQTAISAILGQIAMQEQDAEAFWKKNASDIVVNSFPVLTPLRIDIGQRSRISRVSDAPLQRLRDRAATAGVTMQAALQSAWGRILSAYTGETTSTFGVVLSGRTAPKLEDAFIPCITTLPVVVRSVPSNRELLQSMMEQNATIRRYEHTPLTRLQRWMGYSESSLFDTILVYQQAIGNRDGHLWRIHDETATVDYPISIEVEEGQSGELRFSIDFQSNVLPSEQATLLLNQFDSILVHLLESPDGMADDLSTQHTELYSVLPAEHSELPSEAKLLHQLVEQTATNSPSALALEFVSDLGGGIHSRKWTYRELDQNGNRVAHLLASRGVAPGSIVAVVFDKCPEAYFTILGILKAGCAYVALDPGAPAARHEFILSDSGAAALLVEGGKASDVAYSPPCLLLEIRLDELEPYTSTPVASVDISPEATCYCLYTSGTTGTPKGCLITHDNAVQAMLAFKCLFDGHWDSESRWLQFASFHFDVSVLEQYWSWMVGIPVVSAPRDLILSDLISTISKLEITHIDLTPSLARLVHPDDVPSLCKGVFITGGEQLRQDVLDAWGSKEVIYNAYGPTEATIGVTTFCRVPQNGRSTNIGKQFANVGSYVVRPGSDVPVLKGGVGELCVSGRLVGKGYLNRDDLTNERFPILARYNERVYRTGDLVRVLHDGCFDFLGRADDQVKLRGQRLEIGEINHAIKVGVPEVMDVATIVTKHRGQDRDVIVSFVVTENHDDHKQELAILSGGNIPQLCLSARDACRAKLPGYMVPTYVLCVPYIPLSANNKAQTSVLKKVFNDTSAEQLRNLSSAASNESVSLSGSEPVLCRVISGITRVEEDDIRSSSTIFELGIDSISVIELARQLRAAGFSSAAPSTILQHPRLSSLTQVLRKPTESNNSQILRVKQNILACYHRYLNATCRTYGVSQSDVEYIAPCTPLQEGMLGRSTTSEGRRTYFNSFQLELYPDVSTSRLRDAWEKLIIENATLRTCFLQTSDGYIQVALKHRALKWNEIQPRDAELSVYLAQRHEAWILSNEEVFDTPLEVDCVRHDGRKFLIVRIFHGIYDARSFDLILEHIRTLYNQHTLPDAKSFIDVLPYGPLGDYSSSRPFWEDLFRGFELKTTPTLSSLRDTDFTASRRFSLTSLEEKRIRLGVTQQTIVQALWFSVLLRQFQSWPSLGVVLSGRSLVLDGIENTIGPLFNTLPFRVRENAVQDWASLIREVHNFNATVLSFTHVPLRQIQKWCSHGQPLFDNLFTFDRSDNSVVDADSNLWENIKSTSTADYPLAFEGIVDENNQLTVTIVTQGRVADEHALEEFLDGFQRALSGLERDSDFPEADSEKKKLNSASDGIGYSPDAFDGHVNETIIDTEEAGSVRNEIASLAGVSSDEVGENTTFFELGLDSIDAIKLVARLRRIGISITTSQLMKQPTVRGIIASSSRESASNGNQTSQSQQLEDQKRKLVEYLRTTEYNLMGVESVLPPTPLQDSMVAEMVLSDFKRYFNHDVLKLAPSIDRKILEEALNQVVRSSPILRTRFVEVDDPSFNFAYAQVIAKEIRLFQPEVVIDDLQDINAVVETARNRAVKDHASSDLLQITPVELAGSHYFVLSISHALYDGASLDLFHQDIQAAYYSTYASRRPYDAVLAKIIASSSDAATNFWSALLDDAPHTNLPQTDDNFGDSGSTIHRMEMTSQTSESEIRAFCKRHRITVQALGQACWAAVLGSLVKSLHITFGLVLSGRATEEEQGLLFPVMNTVPMRAILHGTTAEYMQYIWENLANLTEFQHFPLRKAQKLAGGYGPLFNTLFTMQSRTTGAAGDTSPVWESMWSASEVEYPLCVEMEVVGNALTWRVACDENYVPKENVQGLLDQLDQVLGYFLNNEDGQIINFPSGNGTVSVCGLPPFAYAGDDQAEESSSTDAEANGTPQWSEIERKVVDALAEVAGIDWSSIQPNHSIYHLGLDSISAIKAASMLRKRGVMVSVRDLVKATSIRDVAARTGEITTKPFSQTGVAGSVTPESVLDSLDMGSLVARAGLNPAAVQKVLPALPVQVHMLCTWVNTTGDVFFYEFSYDIAGELSREELEKAWKTLVSETHMLRTHFVSTGSREIPFAQIIMSASQKPQYQMFEERGDGRWRYYVESSPFASLQVSRIAAGKSQLKFKLHHALYDGISLPMIVDRFKELCTGRYSPAGSYYMTWDNFALQHYANDTRQKRQDFWTVYLQDARTHPNYEKNALQGCGSRTSVFRPSALDGIDFLKTMASKHGISVQALFLAAYARVLANSSRSPRGQGSDEVVFGVYLANRTSFDDSLHDAPFPTLSILPLRVRLSSGRGSMSLVKVAKRIQTDLKELSSFENASVGLWEIAEWTGVRVDSFVNFLSLPSQDQDSDHIGTGGEIQFTDTTPVLPPEYQGDTNPALSSSLAQPRDLWISDNLAKDAYIDWVDVEVAMNEESLSIGVFGPSPLLSQAQASDLIDSIVEFMQDF